MATYTVTLTYQFPAWDERDYAWRKEYDAGSKSEAIKWARKDAERDGYVPAYGKGRPTFRADISA